MTGIQSQRTILKAGELTLAYENGSIRWIRLGDTEIIRMIYSAVRDCNWGTIEPVIVKEDILVLESSFSISLEVEYKAGPIHFEARYLIRGDQKKLLFEMVGIAQSDFHTNRIGFCILHPVKECAGKTAQVRHADGSDSEFVFPEYISPHQPIKNIQSMTWSPASGLTAHLNLSGDIFEMEDQRNWTDASYKTYCTPLELPFPALVKKGDTVSQAVELLLDVPAIGHPKASTYSFTWDRKAELNIPSLGTAVSSRNQALTQSEIHLLKELPLTHLRVEVNMTKPDCIQNLEKAHRESTLLGWSLFVVLYLSDNYTPEYQTFISACQAAGINPEWILPVGQNHLPFTGFNELVPKLRTDFPQAMIGTGVNAYFAELNRSRPSIEKADFVSFTICPQVHAFDNASLVENLQAQAEVIHSAKRLFPGKPVYVSPVSLRQRFNVVATSDELLPLPDQLPSSVDQRQRLTFAAQWTLGSLKYLSQSGADLVTYYETVGWKGWMQGEQQPENKKLFPAQANEIFPVYEALKMLSGYSRIVPSVSSHPLLFDGLILSSEEKLKIILFNFSAEDIEIRLNGAALPGSTLPDASKGIVKIKANHWVEMEG